MSDYILEKDLWTENDYDQMGWHDATIHAVAFFPDVFEIAFDIDYIFEWIDPKPDETYFSFWVAPATLVFENVNDASIDLELYDSVQLQNIDRGESRRPRNAEYVDRDQEWEWVLDSNVGEIRIWSIGYKMYIRQRPVLTGGQVLSDDLRGGLSFYRGMKN